MKRWVTEDPNTGSSLYERSQSTEIQRRRETSLYPRCNVVSFFF